MTQLSSSPQTPFARPPSGTVAPADVLAVYAEPLIAERRVALIGVGDETLLETILQLGARILYVYDPRPGVVAARGLSEGRVHVVPLRSGGDLGVREGAFDLALVPDLALLGDREAAIAHVRRLIGANGTALIGSRNPDAPRRWLPSDDGAAPPSYTELYDVCSLQFSDVRMIGAAPFAGYAVAEFAPEREPAIAFDASLLVEPEPPEWFVALVAQGPIGELEAYEIVQVPTDAVRAPTIDAAPGVRAQLAATEQKLREAEARAGDQALRAERASNELRSLGEEARKLRDRGAKLQAEADDERRLRARAEQEAAGARRGPDADLLRERVGALEAELIEARTQLATPRVGGDEVLRLQQERDRLAAELTALRERTVGAERAVQPLRVELEALHRRLAERDRELDASLARAQRLEDRLEEQLVESSARIVPEDPSPALQEQLRRVETALGRVQAELVAVQTTHQDEVAAFETTLRARGEELRAARAEIAHRDRLVRELVARLEEGTSVVVAAPVAVAIDRAAEQDLERARRELAGLLEELRRRDAALAEVAPKVEALTRALESERGKNAELARDAARREASLQTASWRISELEKLGTGDSVPGEVPPGGEPARLDAELDALRRALSQEHERAERLQRQLDAPGGGSADDLQRATARLAERETRIAQLSAELAAMRAVSAVDK